MRTPRSWRPAVVAIAGLLCLSVAACGSSTSSSTTSGGTSSAATKKTDEISIGFLIPEENQNAYSASYAANVRKAAQNAGVKVTLLNSNYTASIQQAQMKELIAKKVDGIVLWPGIAGTSLPMLLNAKAAGIPVNISNSAVSEKEAPYYHTYTGTDDFGKGKAQGKLVAKHMNNRGNIVVIEGQPGSGPAISILKGVKAALAEVAPAMKILAVQPGDWQQAKAATATANLLSRYGGRVDAVVASDDVMAAGSAQAIKSAGLTGKVKLFGMGYYAMTPPLLNSGAETATLFQSPCWDGVMALRQMVAVIQGEKVAKQTIMPVPAVAKGTKLEPNGCLPGVAP
jgi:ABC-type sugar transport system substrate-binding protein